MTQMWIDEQEDFGVRDNAFCWPSSTKTTRAQDLFCEISPPIRVGVMSLSYMAGAGVITTSALTEKARLKLCVWQKAAGTWFRDSRDLN